MSSKPCEILIGEDDIEDQQLVAESLKIQGYTGDIAFAKNGKIVMEYLDGLDVDAALPELIILDLNMPIQNGTQTLFQLKSQGRYKHIPVIIYSTSDNEHEKRKCLNYGAVDYIVKPLSLAENERMIAKFLAFLQHRQA